MSLKNEAILDVSHAVVKCESSNIGRIQRGPSDSLVRSTRKYRPKAEAVKAGAQHLAVKSGAKRLAGAQHQGTKSGAQHQGTKSGAQHQGIKCSN